MQVTTDALRAFGGVIRKEFQNGFAGVEPEWNKFASMVNSTTSRETYAWLDDFPAMREWIGDRHRKELKERAYQVRNRDFEATIRVDRNKFMDNELGTYSTVANSLGMSAAENPDILCFETLLKGNSNECYDGQNFFDTEHPVGKGLVSNYQDGGGNPWFLLCTTRPLKPIIYQQRKKADLVARLDPTSDNVFDRREYEWGADSREAAGYGFWQMAFMSKATLTPENYEAARAAVSSFKSDEGKPLGLVPNLLVCGPSLEGDAREILMSERTTGGQTNKWKGTAELLMSARAA